MSRRAIRSSPPRFIAFCLASSLQATGLSEVVFWASQWTSVWNHTTRCWNIVQWCKCIILINFVQLSGGVAEEPVKALERMCRLRKIFKMRRLREAMAELVCDRLAQPHPVGSQFSGEYVFWIVWMWSFHKTHAWLNQKRFVDSRRVFYRID